MTKINRKAVEANLRNKLAAQYKEKTEALQSEKTVLKRLLNEMEKRAIKAEIECDELKEKVAMYEDWNRRLQEFMDMNEDDRKQYVENLRKSNEFDELLKKFGLFTDLYSHLFV